jgi:NAD(P)-dependent dehydrogenase (short-subunit alcohol dehydrogenase family)
VTEDAFEQCWRINTLGLFLVSRAVIPSMKARRCGAIVITGATASRRGAAGTAAFAPAKAAQRSLAEAMAKHLWPLGIHVSLIIVDGVVDLPRTRATMADKPDSFFRLARRGGGDGRVAHAAAIGGLVVRSRGAAVRRKVVARLKPGPATRSRRSASTPSRRFRGC